MYQAEPVPDHPEGRHEAGRTPTVSITSPGLGFDRSSDRERPIQDGRTSASIIYTQTRVIDVRPDVFRRNRLIMPVDTGPAMSAYRQMRTQLLLLMRKNGWKSLGITSPNTSEGKTLTAVNLAISAAMDVNHTVLLADLDLRRPAVHRRFGLESGIGLSDYLAGARDLPGLLFNPGLSRLVILPGGTPMENSSEMLCSPRMAHLADELKTRYASRIVLFDLPPLLATDDVLAFSPYLDAVLLVAEEGRTKKKELDLAASLLGDVPVIGPVVNKSKVKVRVY